MSAGLAEFCPGSSPEFHICLRWALFPRDVARSSAVLRATRSRKAIQSYHQALPLTMLCGLCPSAGGHPSVAPLLSGPSLGTGSSILASSHSEITRVPPRASNRDSYSGQQPPGYSGLSATCASPWPVAPRPCTPSQEPPSFCFSSCCVPTRYPTLADGEAEQGSPT